MTTTTSTFDQRVRDLVAAGLTLREANTLALREERERNERIADATYRRED